MNLPFYSMLIGIRIQNSVYFVDRQARLRKYSYGRTGQFEKQFVCSRSHEMERVAILGGEAEID
jgi:hypothetical protein